jgi:hypothetical protein
VTFLHFVVQLADIFEGRKNNACERGLGFEEFAIGMRY